MASKNPNDLRLQFLLGKAYAQQGKHLKAKKVFQEILQRKQAPVVFLHLGLEFAAMGNLTGAILQWTSVIEQRPNNVTAMRLLARALHKQALELPEWKDQQELFEQSLSWWKRILRLDPGNLRARYYSGIECYKTGRYEQACKHWLILLRAKNKHRKTLKCLTQGLIKLGKLKKARRVALKLARIEKSLPSRKRKYLAWARKILNDIDSGSIRQPTVRDRQTTMTGAQVADTGPADDTMGDALRTPPPQKTPLPPGLNRSLIAKDQITDVKAEELFLDGLDFKDSGQLEKALFAFLEAIDLQPSFTQVYLQIGEVYLQLSKVAKTSAQFDERLALSKQSLVKVKQMSAGSLLAHAAQSKLVVVEKMKRWSFKGFHLRQAHKAIKESREDDAFQEYLLLLSNVILEPGVFLELGSIVPGISKSLQQDVQYFAEDLYKKNPGHPWIEYLLGKIFDTTGEKAKAEEAFNRFLEHFNPRETPDAFKTYIQFIDHPKVDNVDRYIGARLLLVIEQKKEAANLVKKFLENASEGSIFYKDAGLMADQLRRARRVSSAVEITFSDERREICRKVARANVLFDRNLSRSHLDENLLKSMKLFTEQSPDNTLGRFILAWLTEIHAKSADDKKQAGELFHQALTDKTDSADWHFYMGIQALLWKLKDRGMAHLNLVGQILASQGIVDSAAMANRLLVEAERFAATGHHELASALLRQARVCSPGSLNAYLVRASLDFNRGDLIGALGQLTAWMGQILSDFWTRRLVSADIGLILFLSAWATLLFSATVLAAKYFEPLYHFATEFMHQKGIFLSLGLALVAGVLLFFFSTGLIIFLPALLWPWIRDREKGMYLVTLCLLLLIPLVVPISLFHNFELIKQLENINSGNLEEAGRYFDDLGKKGITDYPVQYARALISLREGRLDDAHALFSRLAKHHENDKLFINLGVIAARKGEYDQAVSLFQKALSHEAKSVPALFDISKIYQFRKDFEKADRYRGWAKNMATPEDQFERFNSIPETVSQLVLMDGGFDLTAFDSSFSFFSTENFFKLNANLIGFLTWFIIGGGMVGLLVFSRERLDVVPGRCSICHKVTCNLCQQIISSKIYCDDCAELRREIKTALARGDDEGKEMEGRLKQKRSLAREEQRKLASRKAYLAGMIFPGTAPLFTGDTWASFICQMGFWSCIQGALGGWLLSTVFTSTSAPGAGVRHILFSFMWAGALFFYLFGLVLFHRRKEDVEWI